ncbi:thermonuclease family protein [uncultured Anaerococcus sp.]|uniref:thermonuclease family protein n=1 Tax=uncultured Anaerococcus sp. TaxID=293428 RepID=UPI002608E2D2|nr:thermonuclease family protein [uncultured Anaerococcus sp.]
MRYVWLELPKDSKKPTSDEIKNQMFNAILVRNGYARVKVYKPDVKYTKSLKDIEEDAKNNKVGLWK